MTLWERFIIFAPLVVLSALGTWGLMRSRAGKWGWKRWMAISCVTNTADILSTLYCFSVTGHDWQTGEMSIGISALAHLIGFLPAMIVIKTVITLVLCLYCARAKGGATGGRDIFIMFAVGTALCTLNNLGCFLLR